MKDSELTAFQNEAYRLEQLPGSVYLHSRGLYGGVAVNMISGEPMEIDGYNVVVPSVNGKKIDQLIAEIIQTKGYADILDVGCGNGQYLVDGVHKWGNKFRGKGLTAQRFNHESCPEVCCQTIEQEIKETAVEIRVGDAQQLTEYYPKSSQDIVTAVWVSEYLANSWRMIQEIHQVLRPNGIGIIASFDPSITGRLSTDTMRILEEQGLRFPDGLHDKCDVVMHKRSDLFHLPLTPQEGTSVWVGWQKVPRIFYQEITRSQ